MDFVGAADSFTDCYTYAYALLDQDIYSQIGKTLPIGIGRDQESKGDSKDANDEADRLREKRKKEGKGENNSSGKSDLISTISTIADADRRQKALEFVAGVGNEDAESKAAALKKMKELAGLD